MLNKKKRIHIDGTVEGGGPDYAFYIDPRFDAEEVIAYLESLNEEDSKLMTITYTNANTRCIRFTAHPDIAAEFAKLEYGTMVNIGDVHDLYVSHRVDFYNTVKSLKAAADLVNSAGSVADAVRDLRTCHAAVGIAMLLWNLVK